MGSRSSPVRRKPKLSHDPKHIEMAVLLCELAAFTLVCVTGGKLNGPVRCWHRFAAGNGWGSRVGSRHRRYGGHPIAFKIRSSVSCRSGKARPDPPGWGGSEAFQENRFSRGQEETQLERACALMNVLANPPVAFASGESFGLRVSPRSAVSTCRSTRWIVPARHNRDQVIQRM